MAYNTSHLVLALLILISTFSAGSALKCYFCEGKVGSGDICDEPSKQAHPPMMTCKIWLPKIGGIDLEYICVAERFGNKIRRMCAIKNDNYCNITGNECKTCEGDLCNSENLL